MYSILKWPERITLASTSGGCRGLQYDTTPTASPRIREGQPYNGLMKSDLVKLEMTLGGWLPPMRPRPGLQEEQAIRPSFQCKRPFTHLKRLRGPAQPLRWFGPDLFQICPGVLPTLWACLSLVGRCQRDASVSQTFSVFAASSHCEASGAVLRFLAPVQKHCLVGLRIICISSWLSPSG